MRRACTAWLVLLSVAIVVPLLASPAAPAPPTEPGRSAVPRVAIWPLGDSITNGSTFAAANTPGGYRAPLRERLVAADVGHRFVGTSTENPPVLENPALWAHDGWPGARIDEIDAALDGPSTRNGGWWLTGLEDRAPIRPGVVVVHLGTNDISQAHDPGVTYQGGYTSTDPAERALFTTHLAERLTRLVERLHAARPRARIVLCTVTPTQDPTTAGYNRRIRAEVVPTLRSEGVPVVLADVERSVRAVRGGISPDGVHPTAAGYEAMAAAIAPAVAATVRSG